MNRSLNRKLIRDYTYYQETLDDVKDISKEAEGLFRDALNKDYKKALEALVPNKDSDSKKSENEEDESVHFEDKTFKKLFRKLAVKCHPDKLVNGYSEREKEFLKKCYENLTLANSTYDWGLLLKTAVELDVDIPDLSEDHISNIKENIEKIKENISKYEQSMAYKWYEMGADESKKEYLQQCAGIFMNSLNKKD